MEQTWQDTSKQIAEKIKYRLKELGILRQDFAKMMEVPPSQVTRWLSGENNFEIFTLFKIEEKLGITLVAITKDQATQHPSAPAVNLDQVKINFDAGVPELEASFQAGYSAGVDFEQNRKASASAVEEEDRYSAEEIISLINNVVGSYKNPHQHESISANFAISQIEKYIRRHVPKSGYEVVVPNNTSEAYELRIALYWLLKSFKDVDKSDLQRKRCEEAEYILNKNFDIKDVLRTETGAAFTTQGAVNPFEIWQEFSQYIDSDVDSLSMFAGRNAMLIEDWQKAVKKLLDETGSQRQQGGIGWVTGEYDRLYDQVKSGKRTVCYVDYNYFGSDKVFRDICTIKPETMEFTSRGHCYGSSKYMSGNEKELFIELCKSINVEWLDENQSTLSQRNQFSSFRS